VEQVLSQALQDPELSQNPAAHPDEQTPEVKTSLPLQVRQLLFAASLQVAQVP